MEKNNYPADAAGTNETAANELVLTRVFNAPVETVFKAFSDAEAMAHWWGPKGSKLTVKKFDFTPGGIFHYSQDFGGMIMWGKFRYLEIQAPEKIVFVNSFSDEDGNITPNAFLPSFPLEIANIITLAGQDGKTLLTMRGRPINASEAEEATFFGMIKNMEQGFAGTFEQLDNYLSESGK